MKKLLIALFLTLFMTGSALAAWTCTESRRQYGNYVVITVACAGDGSAETYAIDTYMSSIKGHFLYSFVVKPGAGGVAPDNTFDVDIEDSDAFHILDTDANSNTAVTWNLGSATVGQYPLIKDSLSIVAADIGTAADEVTFELHCVK